MPSDLNRTEAQESDLAVNDAVPSKLFGLRSPTHLTASLYHTALVGELLISAWTTCCSWLYHDEAAGALRKILVCCAV